MWRFSRRLNSILAQQGIDGRFAATKSDVRIHDIPAAANLENLATESLRGPAGALLTRLLDLASSKVGTTA